METGRFVDRFFIWHAIGQFGGFCHAAVLWFRHVGLLEYKKRPAPKQQLTPKVYWSMRGKSQSDQTVSQDICDAP
jgi:hypothetical protein